MHYLELIKDITQIVFWAIAGTVAVLTYRHARRTILQPIRTELFKAQLEAMSKIMGLFLGKDELTLRSAFDFEKLFFVNAVALYDAYASVFFDVHLDRHSRPYNHENCPIIEGYGDSIAEAATGHLLVEPNPEVEVASDPRVRAAQWSRYQHERLYINREFWEMEKRLTELLENPLLPLALIDLLTQYRFQAARNRVVLWEVLAEAAEEMPVKYASLETVERSSTDWLRHRWIAKVEHLKPIAEKIVAFIRAHFDAENLMRA
jgi:hypothetical protein